MNRRFLLPVPAAFTAAVLCSSTFSADPLAAQEGAPNVLPYRGEQPVRARHGMVVSVHHLAGGRWRADDA